MAKAPRRVSLKGKGADIFFGDYAPPGSGDEPLVGEAGERPEEGTALPPPDAAQTQESKPTGETEENTASVPADAQAHSDADGPAGKHENQQAGVQEPQLDDEQPRKAARRQRSKIAGLDAGTHEGAQASELSSTIAPMQPTQQRDNPASGSLAGPAAHPAAESAGASAPDVSDEVWDALDQPATITNSFRYLDREMEGITDALYEIGKEHGVKLTRQEVARLGLNVVLDDYRRHGAGSLLVQLARRRRRRPLMR